MRNHQKSENSPYRQGRNSYKDHNYLLKIMKIEYDQEADAAYIYLKDPIEDGEASKQVVVSEEIILDYNSKGKLLGIEVLHAKKNLTKELLQQAESL